MPELPRDLLPPGPPPGEPARPPKTLHEVLVTIDQKLPQQLNVWGHDGKRAETQRQFSVGKIETNIENLAFLTGTDSSDKEKIKQQFATLYEGVLNGLDPEDYDTLPMGYADRFFVTFPDQLTATLEGQPSRRQMLQTILDIGENSIDKIKPATSANYPYLGEFQLQALNHTLPWNTKQVCIAMGNFVNSLSGGSKEEFGEKLKYLEKIKHSKFLIFSKYSFYFNAKYKYTKKSLKTKI